jgi:hypothetical protein
VSARDEIAAAYSLMREPGAAVDAARAPAVAALRASRVRVSVEAVLAELLGAVVEAFPATARLLSAVHGVTAGWLEDYLRSPELAARPPSTRFATLAQVAATFPAFARRSAAGAPGPLAAILDDAISCESITNGLRGPDPGLAAVMYRLRGPFVATNGLLSPAAFAGPGPTFPRVALAPHARLGAYGRDVAALRDRARAAVAGFLAPLEWATALSTNPAFAARPGPYWCAHVLRPSGEVATIQLARATHDALEAGAAEARAETLDDWVRLAAAGALRAV